MNNLDWLGKLSLFDFLRDIGKLFPVNVMLGRDSVKTRLQDGISFTEFSYQTLQAMDFLHLFQNFNCRLQIGGSDQWGNISAGLDLIRRHGGEAGGVTCPLLTKSNGQKFGKSESGNIWLDAGKTTPYEFSQFWVNQSDSELERLGRIFCDVLPVSQRTLADAVTDWVHGCSREVHILQRALFHDEHSADLLDAAARVLPRITLPDLSVPSLADALGKSRGEIRRILLNNGLRIPGGDISHLPAGAFILQLGKSGAWLAN